MSDRIRSQDVQRGDFICWRGYRWKVQAREGRFVLVIEETRGEPATVFPLVLDDGQWKSFIGENHGTYWCEKGDR